MREPTDTEIDAALVLLRLQTALTPTGSTADHRARGGITAAAGALISGEDPLADIREHYANPEKRALDAPEAEPW
jgi:hypothetical protein